MANRCDWCNELGSIKEVFYYSKHYKRTMICMLCPECEEKAKKENDENYEKQVKRFT